MKKVAVLLSCYLLLLTSCAVFEANKELPVDLNSSESQIKQKYGDPDKLVVFQKKNQFLYYNKGIIVSFDVDGLAESISFYQQLTDWENSVEYKDKFKGKILGILDLGMKVNDINKVLGQEGVISSGSSMFEYEGDGYLLLASIKPNENISEESRFDKGNLLNEPLEFLKIERAPTKQEKGEDKRITEEFFNKYDILYQKDFLTDTKLFRTGALVKDYGTRNIFKYGQGADTFYMKDSTAGDLSCGGEKIPQVLGEFPDLYKLNSWCIYYRDMEIVSDQKPLLVDKDKIISTKCLKVEYFLRGDFNACSNYALLLNNEVIDVEEKQIAPNGEAAIANDFWALKQKGDKFLYGDGYGNFSIFDLLKKDKVDFQPTGLGLEDQVYELDMLNDEYLYSTRRTDFAGKNPAETHSLHYGAKIIDDIYSFKVIDNHLYYVVTQKIATDGSFLIYKASLVKDDVKVADFFIRTIPSIKYDTDLISAGSECLPKSTVCIYDGGLVTVSTFDYQDDAKYPFRSLFLLNGKAFASKKVDNFNYIYPAINEGKVEYLVYGDMMSFGEKHYIKRVDSEVEHVLDAERSFLKEEVPYQIPLAIVNN